MSKVYIKPYSAYTVSGKDFASVTSTNMRRIVFTADDLHCLHMTELRDGCLMISNSKNVEFDLSISRKGKVFAIVKYVGGALKINTNWRLTKTGIENREIHTNPDLVISNTMNLDFDTIGIGRVDLKVDDSGYCACAFSGKELLFVRMNGHHSVPRLEAFIHDEMVRSLESDVQFKEQFGKQYFEKWLMDREWMGEQRLEKLFQDEMVRLLESNADLKEEIGKQYFGKWAKDHEWGLK